MVQSTSILSKPSIIYLPVSGAIKSTIKPSPKIDHNKIWQGLYKTNTWTSNKEMDFKIDDSY